MSIRNYFQDNRLNLRQLRHDLAAAVYSASTAIQFASERPENREKADQILKLAIARLQEIEAQLKGEDAEKALQDAGLVELTNG